MNQLLSPTPKRCHWWTLASTESEAVKNLLRSMGKLREFGASSWPRWLISCRRSAMRTPKQIDTTRAIARVLASDVEKREAFEAAYRINPRGAKRIAESLVAPPPPTREEVRARQRKGVERAVDRRENRARGMLHHHRIQLARALKRVESEKKLIAKWQARVAYYDRKKSAQDAA